MSILRGYLLLFVTITGCLLSEAFIGPVTTRNQRSGSVGQSINTATSTFLVAKRKRRRRKSSDDQDSNDLPDSEVSNSGELPDFELDDGEETPKAKKVNLKPDVITPAMMGSSNRPERSINDLLSDRALEASFEFDEPDDPSLPDLAAIAKPSEPTPGKKKARRAAAIAAKEDEEEEVNIFANLPFVSDEAGNFSTVKVRRIMCVKCL
jgi:hypothetical protein